MANIRKKFKGASPGSVMCWPLLTQSAYARREFGWLPEEEVCVEHLRILCATDPVALRYVAKVLYTYILGYKVDVGHMEAVNLISSHKYSEKQIVSPACFYRSGVVKQAVPRRDISPSPS
jgi:hypothetical protein